MSLIVHTDIAAELATITNSLVEGRVYPLVIPTDATVPAISYLFRDGDRQAFYRDSFGLEDYNLQIDIYSHSYVTNQTIYDTIIDHFNGISGPVNNNTIIQRGIIASTLNSIDGSDPTLYRTITELTLTV